MSYTVEELLKLDTKIFGTMEREALEDIHDQLKVAKKQRTKQYITPVKKEKIKPLEDKFIKPLKEEHLKPIDKVLKELKTYIPKPKPKKAYITLNGQRFGPLSKKEFIELISEIDEEIESDNEE